MNDIIETERLILRPMSVDDAEDVYAWVSDPKVNRYMQYSIYTDEEEVASWLASLKDEDNEFGFELKETGHLIGSGSITPDKYGVYEIGYNIRADYWNQGYATEASQALIDWAYNQLQARHFFGRHVTQNIGSGRVLQKCGFEIAGHGQYSRIDGRETFDATHYKLELE